MKKKSMMIYIFKFIELAACRWYFLLTIIEKCLIDMKWAVILVVFLEKFIGLIENKAGASNVVATLCIYAGILVVIETCSIYYNAYYKPVALPKIQEDLKEKLFQKSISADIAEFDNPEYYNNYIWTLTKADETLNGVINDFASLISNIIIMICISGLFFSINIFIAVAVFASVGITVYIYSFIIKERFKRDALINPYITKAQYFNRVFYLKEYSKELRITNVSKLLFKQFDRNEDSICRINKQCGKKLAYFNMLNGLAISTLLDIGMRVLLTYNLMVAKTITLGEFTASSFAIWSLFSSLNGIMFGLNRFSEYTLWIKKMMEFIEAKPLVYIHGKGKIELKSKENTVSLNRVGFSYPHRSNAILKNIDFHLTQGETVAIVGENGTGKSTLVKLLLGLYEPNEGEVCFNDKKLKDIDIYDYRKKFGVVFQDFSFFSASLAQNIVLDSKYEESEVKNALESSLFYQDMVAEKISIDDVMTREFDERGIVLSGGQAQKFVISRAFLNRPFILMDEPSSALDTLSEQKLNDLILENKDSKGIIIIAHRLTTAKRADRIIVLSEGEIIEEGSHRELIGKRGEYYKMFMLQANQYDRDKKLWT